MIKNLFVNQIWYIANAYAYFHLDLQKQRFHQKNTLQSKICIEVRLIGMYLFSSTEHQKH